MDELEEGQQNLATFLEERRWGKRRPIFMERRRRPNVRPNLFCGPNIYTIIIFFALFIGFGGKNKYFYPIINLIIRFKWPYSFIVPITPSIIRKTTNIDRCEFSNRPIRGIAPISQGGQSRTFSMAKTEKICPK